MQGFHHIPRVNPTYTYQPPADPVPWITERMQRAGALAVRDQNLANNPSRLFPVEGAVTALLDILTQTVSALHDDSTPYQVVLSEKSASAATSLTKKLVRIGSAPWVDVALTEGQRAAVMAGLVLHEIGHIRFSRQYTRSINIEFGGAQNVTNAIHVLSNLTADLHDERAACDLFIGLADAVKVMMWWAGDKGTIGYEADDVDERLSRDVAERVNLAIVATRYPWRADWSSIDGQRWAQWWEMWSHEAEKAGEPKRHAELVREAIEYCRDFTPTPPPPPVDEPPPPPGPGPEGPPPPGKQQPPEKPEKPEEGEDEPPKGSGRPEPSEDPQGEDGDDDDDGDQPSADDGEDETPDEDGDGDGDEDESEEDEPEKPGGKDLPEDEDEDDGPPFDDGDDDESQPDGPTGDESDEDESDDGDDDGDDGNPAGDDEGPTGEDDEPTPPSDKGGMASENDSLDESENRTDMDDPCANKKSQNDWLDYQYQDQYERNVRGKREGVRTRYYEHASSYAGRQAVVLIPRKGGKWVKDI